MTARVNKEVLQATIATRLRLARKARGFTQCQLTRVTGISQIVISKYETGRRIPEICALITLANALAVSVDFLTGGPMPDWLTCLVPGTGGRDE
jgi:transcriptional regulator with XRE-family HTH domain